MLNKQTFLNIPEMIFINLNSTKNYLFNKLIQLILLVNEKLQKPYFTNLIS